MFVMFCLSLTEKADELREEIAILSQTFERVLDRKQAIIQSLASDLLEAEQQASAKQCIAPTDSHVVSTGLHGIAGPCAQSRPSPDVSGVAR